MAPRTHHIRDVDPDSDEEIALVAARMAQTLAEVLGRKRGRAMYSDAWLVSRVRFHLDPQESTGAVLLAERDDGQIDGHVIVRREVDEGDGVGLFSTTYVTPEARGLGVGGLLLESGEGWMRQRRMRVAMTYTHPGNTVLIGMYADRGYELQPVNEDFVRLRRDLVKEST